MVAGQSRDAWLTSLTSGIPSTPAILHLSKLIDVSRVNLFDTVTQYKAIFPSSSVPSSSLLSSSASSAGVYDSRRIASSSNPGAGVADVCQDDVHGVDFNDSKILTSWLLQKIDSCLQIITEDLISCIESEPFYPIDSIIDPCFYFGLSLTRVGADIRPRLMLIFNNIFLRRFKRVLGRATNTFLESLNSYTAPADGFSLFLPEENDDLMKKESGPANPPKILLQFEPLAVFLNGIISALNEIRSHASIMIVCKIRDALTESLVRGTAGIHTYCR